MNNTRIEWCDTTINPVVGCPRGCEYCYARKMNMRFKWIVDFSEPQFFPERLKLFEKIATKSIFINSMSDVAFWTQKQFDTVAAAINANPQHRYIFLTKDMYALRGKLNRCNIAGVIPNAFFGATVTTQEQYDALYYEPNASDTMGAITSADFLNIEPILQPINLHGLSSCEFSTIIIGAETGNRRGKVIPRKEWVDDIVAEADKCGLLVFMKNSLRGLMGADFRQDPLIWDILPLRGNLWH